jgi:hypothetical protein
MKPLFSLPNGEVLLYGDTNKHHTIWNSYQYAGRFERNNYREMSGFVIRMAVSIHNELHANVEPPIKPIPNLMRAMVEHNKMLEPLATPYEKFQDMTMYLGYLSAFAKSQQMREEAHQLHDNFKDQALYINEGRVEYYGTW